MVNDTSKGLVARALLISISVLGLAITTALAAQLGTITSDRKLPKVL